MRTIQWRVWLLAALALVALQCCQGRLPDAQQQGHRPVAAVTGAAPGRRRGLRAAGSSSSSSGGGGRSLWEAGGGQHGGAAGAEVNSASATCSPSLASVARQLPELRQVLQLSSVGYDLFNVDGSQPFTVLAPTDRALQQLARGIQDSDQRQELQRGFYSIILYNQLPQGAYNLTQLRDLGSTGLQTSLGRAMNKGGGEYTVSFDGSNPWRVFATGGWPANNAGLLSSHAACNGWLHVVDAVLQPTQQFTNLPKLVDTNPDLQLDSFWKLLDGSNTSSIPELPDAEPAAPEEEGGGGHHSNDTGIVISDAGPGGGNASAAGDSQVPPESSGGGGGSSDTVLVVAASCAGAAVAACIAIVAAVTLHKRKVRRRRHQASRLGADEEDEEEEREFARSASVTMAKTSGRPVQLHVDA